MKSFNASLIKSETLRQIVEALDTFSANRCAMMEGETDYRQICQAIGAHAAYLDTLADKMAGLWLFGARFTDDAEQLRAFCDYIIAKAEELAKLAELDGVEIVEKAATRVYHWITRSERDEQNERTAAQYGVNVRTVEVLRDIETLTEEEAAQKYTAEELAEAERLGRMEAGEPETTTTAATPRRSVLSLFAAFVLVLSSLFCSCSEPANARRVAGDSVEMVHWFCCRGGVNAVGVIGSDSVAFHLDTDSAKWARGSYRIASDSLTVYPCHTERSAWTGNTNIILD